MALRDSEAPILAAVFLDLMGFGMVLADIQLRAEAMAPKGWRPGWIIGGLLASTFVTQMFASPRWGRLSDRRGRKPVFVLCTVLSAVAMLVYGLAGSLGMLLLSRIISGLGAANVAVLQAYLSDRTDPSDRAAALGRIGAAISAGLVVGPPLGGFLAASGGNHLIGLVAGSASLIGAIWMARALPNLPPHPTEEPEHHALFDLRLLKELPAIRSLVLIAAVAWFSLAMLEGTFARLISYLYAYDQRQFGLLFGYESFLGIVIQASLVGWVVTRVRESNVLRISYLAQGLGLAANPFAATLLPIGPPFVLLVIASTLYSVGSSLANPTLNSLCSRLTPDSRQGELFGLMQGARSVGFVVGPVLGGALFDWQPAAPYIIAGVVCVLASALVPSVLSQPDPGPSQNTT